MQESLSQYSQATIGMEEIEIDTDRIKITEVGGRKDLRRMTKEEEQRREMTSTEEITEVRGRKTEGLGADHTLKEEIGAEVETEIMIEGGMSIAEIEIKRMIGDTETDQETRREKESIKIREISGEVVHPDQDLEIKRNL